jgi:hypothetical protein
MWTNNNSGGGDTSRTSDRLLPFYSKYDSELLLVMEYSVPWEANSSLAAQEIQQLERLLQSAQ